MENVRDLFKILTAEEYLALILEIIYKPTLVGYNNNYIEYRSEGDKLLTVEEYLENISRK